MQEKSSPIYHFFVNLLILKAQINSKQMKMKERISKIAEAIADHQTIFAINPLLKRVLTITAPTVKNAKGSANE